MNANYVSKSLGICERQARRLLAKNDPRLVRLRAEYAATIQADDDREAEARFTLCTEALVQSFFRAEHAALNAPDTPVWVKRREQMARICTVLAEIKPDINEGIEQG